MDTRKVDEYLKRLKRRERFLENRVEGKEEDKSHYDRSELLALLWVIRYIEDTQDQAIEHQYRWFNERVRKDD